MNIFSLFIIILIGSQLTAQSILEQQDIIPYKGLFNFYYSADDKIYLEITELDSDFLYVNSLSQGLGSNDLGLDRGQLGEARIVKFLKAGNKLLLIQPNLAYRAVTDNEPEKRSVEQAFAKSVLFGFPILEKTDIGYLVDLTPFLIQDEHGVAVRLKSRKQGSYTVDKTRSALNMEQTRAFPENVDFEAIITLKGKPEGKEIRSVTPDPGFVTVYQHYSFVKLPDSNYQTRAYDRNSGGFALSFMDYAAPIDASILKQFAVRHRLKKKNPTATISEAIEPIIYYLDNGTPEPVRSALLDGARWWNTAFEAIGYKDAFQVKILSDSIDPLDVRYNVIQWVHRSTRGWSYGAGVIDPRTGEIIKGHVSLGSLRVRQDFLLAQALMNAPFASNDDNSDAMLQMALARIRQLSAHEVGHTLGFSHNFAASTNNLASVMDYPHPAITLKDGEIDMSNAYATGIGEWDQVTVAYAYSEFVENESAELKKILSDANKSGLRYISDQDARSQGGANIYGHLWDNGANATDELINVMAVRAKAIEQFGIDNIRNGDDLEKLEDLFVLLYFYHRYQTEAVVKLIGGIDYAYFNKGDEGNPATVLALEEQRTALEYLLKTIKAEFLAVPKPKLALFNPRGMVGRTRESFSGQTGVAFDPFGAVSTGADMTLGLILNPQRVSRLINQKALDPDQLGLEELLDKLIENTFLQEYNDPYLFEVQETINYVFLQHLMGLAQSKRVYPQAGIIIDNKLMAYKELLLKKKSKNKYDTGYIRIIDNYFKDPSFIPSVKAPQIPDGSPIGSPACNIGWDGR